MGLKTACEIWDDVIDEALDERQAPEIDEVVTGSAHRVYSDPKEFYDRTYLSSSIKEVLRNIVKVLTGQGGNNILVLYSLFGGGKTHTLIAIHHGFKEPVAIQDSKLAAEIRKSPTPKTVIIFGKNNNFSSSPSHPLGFKNYKIHTVWGYLAHCFGRFDEVKVDDRNLTVPGVDILRRVLGSEPTIILMDEIVDYGVNLVNSKDAAESKYAQSLPLFLDRLATAAIGTNTVIVVTFPIRVGGKKDQIERVEARYAGEEKYVEAMWDAVKRVGSRIVAPLEAEEVVSVLQQRMFKRRDEKEAQRLSQDLRLDYEASEDIFGDEAYSVALRISDSPDRKGTYPYHPDYADVLRDIVERTGLQRTRDLIRVTRVAVRRIWNEKDDPALVMPWHIDLSDSQLKNLLLSSSSLKDYAVAVDRDIFNNTAKSSKPRLARITATAIFLKTYIYDTPLPINQCPTANEIARLTYDPSIFAVEKWKPADIPDIVRELQTNLIFFLEKEGRYWFWRIATIKEQVEAEAKKLRDQNYREVVDWLTGFVDDATWGKLELAKGRKEVAARKKSSIFAYVKPVSAIRDLEIPDDGRYKLLVLVSDSVVGDELKKREERARELIGNVIFKIGETQRNERNAVYVLLPSTQDVFQRAVELAARRLACDRVTDEIKTIYKGAAKEVIEVQQGIINNMKEETIRKLGEVTLGAYTCIAYPSISNGNECVKVADTPAGTASTSLIDAAESALSQAGFDKFYPSMRFYTLRADFSKRLGIDLVDGDKNHYVRDIKSHFKTNPRLPAVDEKTVISAVEEGIKALAIGLSSQDRVWYKRIYNEPPDVTPYASDTEGECPAGVGDDDQIVPWRIALKEQANHLIARIGVRTEGDKAYKQWYEVLYHGKTYDLRELLKEPNWHDIGKLGFIIKRLEEVKESFAITLQPASRTVRPNESVEVSVKVDPIGKFNYDVALSSDIGSLTPQKARPSFESLWKLTAPPEPGQHRISLTGMADDLKSTSEIATLTLLIERDILELPEIGGEQVGHTLLGIRGMRELTDLSSLEKAFSGRNITASTRGNVVVYAAGASVGVRFDNVDLRVVKQLSEDARAYLEGEVKELELEVTVSGEPVIDELLQRELSKLNKRVQAFKVKRKLT